MGHLGLRGPSGCPRSDDLHPTKGLVRGEWAVWREAGREARGSACTVLDWRSSRSGAAIRVTQTQVVGNMRLTDQDSHKCIVINRLRVTHT